MDWTIRTTHTVPTAFAARRRKAARSRCSAAARRRAITSTWTTSPRSPCAACSTAAREPSTPPPEPRIPSRSEEHTSELQSQSNLVCRLLLEKKKNKHQQPTRNKTHDIV